jgi:glycosyltransferase involved in cell wall biosynthesis
MRPMRLAFVTPWFGDNLPGGAEAVTRELIRRLRAEGIAVEVLTTCIRDFHADWSVNHHAPGVRESRVTPVRRFTVQRRDQRRFDQINKYLMFEARGRPGTSPLSAADERAYIDEQIRCPSLTDHLREHREDYDAFVFMPYMFATTVYGVEAVGGRAVIIPALHDESYAYMDIYRRMAAKAGRIVTQTPEEDRLVRRIWGEQAAARTRLLGMGIDTDWHADGRRFRERFGIEQPFLLSVGRRDTTKGLYRLLWNWLEYRRAGGQQPLVMIGPGRLPAELRRIDGLIDLGFVDRQSKYDAHAAASVLVQPSQREAFSIVVLESWLAGRPVLVEGRSAVNRDHCLRGGGGLYYETTAEFIEAVRWFEAHDSRVPGMVGAAREYVIENYTWPGVIERFCGLFEEMAGRPCRRERAEVSGAIVS